MLEETPTLFYYFCRHSGSNCFRQSDFISVKITNAALIANFKLY